MPEPAVAAPPAAAPPSPAPSSAPPSTPASPSAPSGGAPPTATPETGAPETSQVSDADLKFEFGFEGESTAEPAAELGDPSDYSKPFSEELKTLLKDKPELLRAAQRDYYENRGYKQVFKTPQEAQAFREDVNSLAVGLKRADGTEGLDAIRAEAAEWASTWEGFQKGDEGVVKQWFSDIQPEAADKLMTAALGQFKDKSPNGWARQMAQTFMGELRAADSRGNSMLTALNRIADMAKDNPDIQRELGVIAQTVNQIDEISRQAPMQNQPADADRQSIEKEKRGLFVEKLSMRVMPMLNKASEKAAETVLRGRKLGPEASKQFSQEIQGEYNRITKLDKEFQKKARTLLDAGDVQGFERLSQAQIQRKMPDAARNIYRKYTGFNGNPEQRRAEGANRTEGPSGGSGTGAKLRYNGKIVNGGPDPSVIDWGAMRAMAPAGQNPRQFAEDMLFRREFRVKGDAKNLYFF